jgi:hypothetical protein
MGSMKFVDVQDDSIDESAEQLERGEPREYESKPEEKSCFDTVD